MDWLDQWFIFGCSWVVYFSISNVSYLDDLWRTVCFFLIIVDWFETIHFWCWMVWWQSMLLYSLHNSFQVYVIFDGLLWISNDSCWILKYAWWILNEPYLIYQYLGPLDDPCKMVNNRFRKIYDGFRMIHSGFRMIQMMDFERLMIDFE